MNVLKFINEIYWRYMRSSIDYARHLGVTIGEHTTISIHDWSSEPYLVTIGNHVQITRGVSIHTHGGGNAVRQTIPDFDVFGKVVIEDWCYIGAHSQIMPGVTIGEGSLVAAGSVVTKSIPPHSVVGGNPAKVLCTINDYLERNIDYNTHTKGMDVEQKRKLLLSLPDEKFIKK